MLLLSLFFVFASKWRVLGALRGTPATGVDAYLLANSAVGGVPLTKNNDAGAKKWGWLRQVHEFGGSYPGLMLH